MTLSCTNFSVHRCVKPPLLKGTTCAELSFSVSKFGHPSQNVARSSSRLETILI